MDIPVQATIEALTPTVVAREMGLPISTIHRWMTEDRIPGQGVARQWRKEQFETAVRNIRAATPKPRKKAA